MEEDLKAELERLKAENEQLESQRRRSASLEVSEKGIARESRRFGAGESSRSPSRGGAWADAAAKFLKAQ